MNFKKLISLRKNAQTGINGLALRPLVVLGSSVSEQFDYIFGDHPDYYPFWASGWTARSLRELRSDKYLAEIMRPVPRQANVFLSFGSMDVNFAAQRKANAKGCYDFDGFLNETVDAIVHGRNTLLRLGFNQVRAVFIAPVIDLPDAYWKNLSIDRQLPTAMRARMSYDLALKVGGRIPTINLLHDMVFSSETPLAKAELVRAEFEHHVDYIAAQDIVWQGIKNIPGMIPRRKPWHDALYPHATNWIMELREAGMTRPKTCN